MNNAKNIYSNIPYAHPDLNPIPNNNHNNMTPLLQ